MAGTFTERRNLPSQSSAKITCRDYASAAAGSTVPEIYKTRIDNQVTTSYRSRDDRGQRVGREDGSYFDSLVDEVVNSTPQNPLNMRGVRGVTDTGHPFSTVKQWKYNSMLDFYCGSSLGWYRGALAVAGASDWQSIPVWNSSLDGTNAIKATIPTNSVANLAVDLAEIVREGIPKAIGSILDLSSRAAFYRSLGSEYLNVQFGWVPFVRSIQKTISAMLNASQIISQYERDSGRVVRRKFGFQPRIETQNFAPLSLGFYLDVPQVFLTQGGTVVSSPWQHLFSDYVNPGNPGNNRLGRVTRSIITRQDVWFSGAYSYYLPKAGISIGQDLERFEALANKLLGTRLTPEVLWNLTPWSWLADWFANIGDNLAVASARQFDGLVIRWGWLMRKTHIVDTSVLKGVVFRNGFRGDLETSFHVERKERVEATSSKFALQGGALSAAQLAILAALGMTRAPGILK